MSFWRRGRLAIARSLGLDLTHTQERYAGVLRSTVVAGARWLELGCGSQIVPDWAMPLTEQREIAARAARLVGVDADQSIRAHPLLRERVLGLGGALPFVDGSFDLVTANMVVEHVRDPRSFLADVHRVLRPGGAFLLHTPNRSYYLVWLAARIPEAAKRGLIYLLDTRREKDVFPTFYRMNTPARIQRLAEECGFHVERLSVQGSSGSFGRLGPLGWLECVILKLNCAVSGGRFQSNLLAILRRR